MNVLGYLAVEGSGIGHKQAAIYGEALMAAFKSKPPTPDDVVRLARPARHPLHDFFEWDDSEAARKFREEQARRLLRSIAVTYQTTEGPQQVRLFISVADSPEKHNAREYHQGITVLSDAELRARHVAEFKRRLSGLRHELARFEEFAAIVQAIDALAPAA